MIRELPPYVIQVGEDYHRDLPRKGLRQLVLSIAEIGLTDPIIVRRKAGKWRLVAGRRRLAAVMQLERATVPCRVIRANDRRAKMIELDFESVRCAAAVAGRGGAGAAQDRRDSGQDSRPGPAQPAGRGRY